MNDQMLITHVCVCGHARHFHWTAVGQQPNQCIAKAGEPETCLCTQFRPMQMLVPQTMIEDPEPEGEIYERFDRSSHPQRKPLSLWEKMKRFLFGD